MINTMSINDFENFIKLKRGDYDGAIIISKNKDDLDCIQSFVGGSRYNLYSSEEYNLNIFKHEDLHIIFSAFFNSFKFSNNNLDAFHLDICKELLFNSIFVLQSIKGFVSSVDLENLLLNTNGQGRQMVTAFSRQACETPALAERNMKIASYFLADYYNDGSSIYLEAVSLRRFVSFIVSINSCFLSSDKESEGLDKLLSDTSLILIESKFNEFNNFLSRYVEEIAKLSMDKCNILIIA